MATIITEPELLVSDAHGVYIMQSFCRAYEKYILNKEKLKEDIAICLEGPEHEHYNDSWANLLDNVELTNDNGDRFTIGNLGEGGDLWAIPEGYEYPEM
jgi:hypothetical protein